MTTILGLYFIVSLILVAYCIVNEDADIAALKPTLGRRIVVLLFVPAGSLLIAVASLLQHLEGDDWKEPWRDLCLDLKDAWNGR